MESIAWGDLSQGLQIAVIAYAVVQVGVEVWALVDLVRTPVERVQTGKKWLWALIIVFVNLIGAIVWFVAGKKPTAVADPARQGQGAAAPGEDRARKAADLLYGPGGDATGDRR